MSTIGIIGLAYLLGSISFAVLVSRAFGLPDPRSFGSKNPGATNVLRTGKKAAALLTLLGDGAKGWAAVFAAHFYFQAPAVLAAVALAVFIGHLFPIFFGFHGGKGVATALGVLLALNPWLGLAAAATWLSMALAFRISSLSALTAAVLCPVYSIFLLGSNIETLAVLAMSLLLVWRHKSNIANLLQGKEGSIKTQPAESE